MTSPSTLDPVADATAAPEIHVEPDPADVTRMSVLVTVDNHGNGPVILAWGQTPPLPTNTNRGDDVAVTKKKYTVAGDWIITATPIAQGVPAGQQPVTIPWPAPAPAPVVTVTPQDSDVTGMTVQVTVDNHGNGPVALDWGQTPPLAASTNPGDGTTPTDGTYTVAGTWTITATDTAHPLTPPGTAQVTVPLQDPPVPVVSVDPSDPTGMTVLLVVDNHDRGPVTVDWGQTPALPADVNAGDGHNPSQAVYTVAGTWRITVRDYAASSVPAGTVEVTVPMAMPPALTVGAAPADGTHLLTWAVVDSRGRGLVALDFGDGTDVEYNVGDGTTPSEHAYAAAGDYTVTATLVGHPDDEPVTVTVTVPWADERPPAVTIRPDPDNHMGVLVLVDSRGRGDVTIDWGQDPALPVSTNPGDGVTVSRQVYTAQGTWTIVVADAFDPDATRVNRKVALPTPPPPDLTFVPDPYDPSGMNVYLVTDSHGYGIVKLNPGGGMDVVFGGIVGRGDGSGTLARYRQPGLWTVTASGYQVWNMPTVTAQLEVPFPRTPTLRVTRDLDDPAGFGVVVVVDNHGLGDVEIDWGQNPALPATVNAGDGTAQTRQTYTATGTWTITARALADDHAPPASRTIALPFPDAPTVTVARDTDDPSGMSVLVTVDHYGLDPVQLDWGQTPALPATVNYGDPDVPTRQTYTRPGVWTIRATVPGKPEIPAGTATVFLPQPPAPRVEVAYDPADTTRRTVLVTVDNHGNGPVDLNWNDRPGATPTAGMSTYPAVPASNPGDGTTAAVVTYTSDGAKAVEAVSQADPTLRTRVVFPIPSVDRMLPPTVRLGRWAFDTQPTMTISANLFGHNYGPAQLDWGQTPPLPPAVLPGDGNAHATATDYTADGTWTLKLASTLFPDGPVGTVDLLIPHPVMAKKGPELVGDTADPEDPSGLTHLLEFDSYGNGDILVDWQIPDFNIAPMVVPGDRTPVKFRPVTAAPQFVPVISLVADPCNTDQFPFNTVPPGSTAPPIPWLQPDPDDPSGMTVGVKLSFAGGATIDWGQTPALEPGEHPGDNSVVSRTYTTPGRWTVTVASKDNPALSWPTTITVPAPSVQPAPRPKVHADPNDPSGMTIAVLVDNDGNGPAVIDWGQTPALTPATNPGDGNVQTVQVYTTPGTWTVTVTDQTNPYAPAARTQVTVPVSPAPSVLIGEDGSGDGHRNRLRATVNKPKAGKSYEINWGQGSGTAQDTWLPMGPDASMAAPLGHGVWTVAVRERSTPSLASRGTVTVPRTGPLVTLTPGTPGGGTVTVTAVVDDAVDGHAYEIEWGTGTGFVALAGTPPTGSKPLTTPGTYQVTVRDKADQTDSSTNQVHLA